MSLSPWRWLVEEWRWPKAALWAAPPLLALVPLWVATAGPALALVYLQLPIYLLHQYEEHRDDRFRRWFNGWLADGREALTPTVTFWINALAVWALDLVVLYLAFFVDLGWGLVSLYLTVANGVVHVAVAAARRAYNPGLWTALGLFLPLGGWGLRRVAVETGAPWRTHALIGGLVLLGHAFIILHMRLRLARLRP